MSIGVETSEDIKKEETDSCAIKVIAQDGRAFLLNSLTEGEKAKMPEKMPVEILLQVVRAYTRFLR